MSKFDFSIIPPNSG